ncbi:MAG: ATPase [Saprospiraceae bacterium]|nr:ATPase [Saprospiraceae bacterium]
MNILCISRFFKGVDFMRAGAAQNANMFLLTSLQLKEEEWPYDILTDKFYVEEDEKGNWDLDVVINGLAHTMKHTKFDILVALDDFDVENTAFIREYFRIPGMGETTSRYFRDKLAMRMKAAEHKLPNPLFSALFHDSEINEFLSNTPPPYMIKPRGQASATGIKKVHNAHDAWEAIHHLGDHRHEFLIEAFKPGDVFHVDSLIWEGKVIFSNVSKYLDTPFEVAHGGGIFRSVSLAEDEKDAQTLTQQNADLLSAFGIQYGASHSEYIRDIDGNFNFLETSSRVGGANLAEMVEAASGINLWAEWAKIEIAAKLNVPYKLPETEKQHAGIVISLSRYEWPDLGPFVDEEICWKMIKKHHIGFIVRSKVQQRVVQLLETYTSRIQSEYHASLPAPDRPTN